MRAIHLQFRLLWAEAHYYFWLTVTTLYIKIFMPQLEAHFQSTIRNLKSEIR